MATHSNVLAWRVPGTGEPGGLPSMGSHRVGHDWNDLAAAASDCNPPGYSVHGILQARILEWIALPFSRGSSWFRDWIWVSHISSRFFTIWATREAQRKSCICVCVCVCVCVYIYIYNHCNVHFKCIQFCSIILQKNSRKKIGESLWHQKCDFFNAFCRCCF